MKINVTRSSLPSYEEYCEEIKDIWQSHWLTNNGVHHQQLEKQLKQYLDVPELVLLTNGHLALELVIQAFDFPKGSEVITTPFTFVSTTNAIVRNGLVPVFCDVNKDDYTIDVQKIEELITPKTVAIVPVHVYGNICDVAAIDKISKKHHLKVIYDAAHAFGVKYKNQGIGRFGDANMFSFHATKVFNTIEGGCVTFKDKSLYNKLEAMKNFGLTNVEEVEYFGPNAKMNEFQACMGLCNLRHIDEYISGRKKAVARYYQRLNNVKGIKLCKPQEDVITNYAYLPIIFDGYKYNRDEICTLLADNGILARKYFYPLTNDFSAYKSYQHGDTKVAEYLANRVLTLPLYHELSEADVDLICDIILK